MYLYKQAYCDLYSWYEFVLQNKTETLINAHLLSDEIGKYVSDKVSNLLDTDKIDLQGLCMIGNYHINAFGTVVTGDDIRYKLRNNQHCKTSIGHYLLLQT
ncbi:MAG: hypothetical protein MRQ09_01600 [Candidatus Midichloria sp.]|nr:hypothetical protein [Candidatus Midichloria sp.]